MSSVLSKYKPPSKTLALEEIEQIPTEAKNIETYDKKSDGKDKDQISIMTEGANDSTVGNEIDLTTDLDSNGEISEQGKLEQEIE